MFSHDLERMKVSLLAKALAEFVYLHRDERANFEWPDVPEGFSSIGVFPALDGHGRWLYFRVGDTVAAPKELLESRIAEKNARLTEYREAASEVWLLILNNLFLGPGEVCLRDEDLAQWSFRSDFDKVLVFERQPGGSGRVIELRRY